MTLLAVIGPTALYLLYSWLASAIAASDLSNRKGYGEKPGLASGIFTSAIGVIVWLFWPAKPGSPWSRYVKIVDLLMAVLALVLLVTLFIDWYSNGESFFQGMAVYELLVPLAAAVGYGQLHARASGHASDGLGVFALAATALGAIAALIAIATPPDDSSLEFASYIGVAAAVAMALAAALAWRVDRSATGQYATVAEARELGAEHT
jgi:hypothetical protein